MPRHLRQVAQELLVLWLVHPAQLSLEFLRQLAV